MTEVVPSSALSEVSLRLLCHDDIDTVKHLCGDWFPIEYPDSWYRDITSNKKFFSLAATYRGAIVGMIVAEIKSRTKIHKEAPWLSYLFLETSASTGCPGPASMHLHHPLGPARCGCIRREGAVLTSLSHSTACSFSSFLQSQTELSAVKEKHKYCGHP